MDKCSSLTFINIDESEFEFFWIFKFLSLNHCNDSNLMWSVENFESPGESLYFSCRPVREISFVLSIAGVIVCCLLAYGAHKVRLLSIRQWKKPAWNCSPVPKQWCSAAIQKRMKTSNIDIHYFIIFRKTPFCITPLWRYIASRLSQIGYFQSWFFSKLTHMIHYSQFSAW